MRRDLVALLFVGSALGCSDRPASGQLHGGCYPDGTCVPGLVCNSGFVCETADASADAITDATDVADALDAMDAADSGADIVDVPVEAGPMNYAAPATSPASCDDLSTGTDIPGVLADNATSALRPLPFAWAFFGLPVDHYSVASNGYVQLWSGDTGVPGSFAANVAIPNASAPNGFAAPLWTHLAVTSSSRVRSAVFGSAPSRRFTIEWSQWTLAGQPTATVSFQVKLFEATNAIEFDYCGLAAGASTTANATIGLENESGDAGVSVAFDMAGAVTDNTALRFTPSP